jgi:WD40 repeat protein
MDASFAVGISDKTIKIFSRNTCQEQQQLKTTQAAKLLAYGSTEKLLAVSTVHFLEVYRPDTRSSLWKSRLEEEILAIAFAQNDSLIHAIDKGGGLLIFSVVDGSIISAIHLSDPVHAEIANPLFRRAFNCATISLELSMVAAAQRGSPLGIYDLTTGDLMGTFSRDEDFDLTVNMDHAPLYFRDLAFSPKLEPCLLAVLHHDGCLVVVDPCVLEVQAQVMTEGHQVLACSPDGRTLATGSDSGTLQIYDFETLNILYKTVTVDYTIKSIAFTSDSLRMLDLRGSQCNIWEPAVLARSESGETDGVSDAAPIEANIVGVPSNEPGTDIAAMTCHPSGAYVICGKENGKVSLYSTATGKENFVLYAHANGVTINSIQIGSLSRVVASSDAASRILVWRLIAAQGSFSVEGPVLDERIGGYPVNQILLSPDEQKILVSTLVSDIIYELHTGEATVFERRHRETSWRWVNHPTDASKLLHITALSAHIHTWARLSECDASSRVTIGGDLESSLVVKSVALCWNKCQLIVEYASSPGKQSTSHTLILPTASLQHPLSTSIESLPTFSKLVPHIEYLIGSLDKRLFFLNRQMWICGLDLDSFQGVYDQHCCIPDEWFSANWNLMLRVTRKGDFVFVRRTEIAIIKRALGSKEAVSID